VARVAADAEITNMTPIEDNTMRLRSVKVYPRRVEPSSWRSESLRRFPPLAGERTRSGFLLIDV